MLRDIGDASSIPATGRSPGEGNGNQLQYSCPSCVCPPQDTLFMKQSIQAKTDAVAFCGSRAEHTMGYFGGTPVSRSFINPAQALVKELLRPAASQPFRERRRCSGSKSHLLATRRRACTCARHPSLWLQEHQGVRVRVEDTPWPPGPVHPATGEGSSCQQNCCGATFKRSPLCATLCLRATLLISLP